MTIKNYSGTPGNNQNVDGTSATNIAEQNNPATINNALRQIMADLKNDLVAGGNWVWELQGGASLVLVKLAPEPDGVTFDFTMSAYSDGSPITVVRSEQVHLLWGGVRQEPGKSYAAFGSTLSFFTPPAVTDDVFAIATIGDIEAPTLRYKLYEDGSFKNFVARNPSAVPADEDPNPQDDEVVLGRALLESNTV